ncbi:nucleoside-diphosphate sugar epimerase/dehydratase [Prochlorococcus marinus]|uniref:nucleoside-diphosphate sugar epimerase/dehydratase n=1 Tax=Prochlorococcus marinus TaxID=1219 RepID=UPI001FD641D8|nr:nucleoside-diphosphate sugar epimerase/dehydratase [Prochlorococcus marinus]
MSNPYSNYFQNSLWIIPVMSVLAIPIYIGTGYYRGLLTYNNSFFIYKSSIINFLLVLVSLLIGYFFNQSMPPRSIWPLMYIIIISLNGLVKIGLRDYVRSLSASKKESQNVVIYGAGSAGAQLINSLSTIGNYKIKFIIDDDKNLIGRSIGGIKIFSPEYLKNIKYKIDNILLAIPSASIEKRKQIIYKVQDLGFSILEVPTIEEITEGKAKIDNLRRIEIENLLERDIVLPIPELLEKGIKNKNILITGAGGSIGSEISNQIIKMEPRNLILVDSNEKNLYELINNLGSFKKNTSFILGNCCDEKFMNDLLQRNNIELIFHTSAYKHVNLVEENPIQGLYNNIISSLIICKLSSHLKIPKVILISSDKAVRPKNIMGASKRVSEILFQAFDNEFNETCFSMVRFGNVLNSSGSVIPLFKNQIKSRIPLTVTHPEVIRYFMTIKEASQLVIQASALAKGGEVFLLDMGEPIKILNLAKQMIKLSGLTIKNEDNLNGDLEIIFTGLRPGEKLYEELLIDNKSKSTIHPLIYKAEEKYIIYENLMPIIDEMEKALINQDLYKSLSFLKQIVPEWERSN